MQVSKWAFTQATAEVSCDKCKAAPGEPCKTPKGRKALEPHTHRSLAYMNSIGKEEFTKRHSIKVLSISEVMNKFSS